MTVLINLTCPSCGGKLQIPSDIERFACGNCGTELIVQRSGGVVTLAMIECVFKTKAADVEKPGFEKIIEKVDDIVSVKDSESELLKLKKEIDLLTYKKNNLKGGFLFGPIVLGILTVYMFINIFSGEFIGTFTVVTLICGTLCYIGFRKYIKVTNDNNNQKIRIDKLISEKEKEYSKRLSSVQKS